MKKQFLNEDQVMYDIAKTPVKQLTDDEQEWLGIFHSAVKIEHTLKRYPDFYSNAKKEAMYRFLREIDDMKDRFEEFYRVFLRKG